MQKMSHRCGAEVNIDLVGFVGRPRVGKELESNLWVSLQLFWTKLLDIFRLANWVSNGSSSTVNATSNTTDVTFYLSVYGSVAVANTVFSLIRAFLFAYGGICAAQTIHSQLLRAVLRGKVGYKRTFINIYVQC